MRTRRTKPVKRDRVPGSAHLGAPFVFALSPYQRRRRHAINMRKNGRQNEGITMIFEGTPELACEIFDKGRQAQSRPGAPWAPSTHPDLRALARARTIGLDYIVLGRDGILKARCRKIPPKNSLSVFFVRYQKNTIFVSECA